jgi:hypothetical protein
MHSNPVIASLAQRGAAIQSRQTATGLLRYARNDDSGRGVRPVSERRQMPKFVKVFGTMVLTIVAGYLIYRLGYAAGFWFGSN